MYRGTSFDYLFNDRCCREVEHRLRSGDRLLCVAGHAGSGKTTVVRRALKKCAMDNQAKEISIFGCETGEEVLLCLLTELSGGYKADSYCNQKEFLLSTIKFPEILVLLNSSIDVTLLSTFKADITSVVICVYTPPLPSSSAHLIALNPYRIYTEGTHCSDPDAHTLSYGMLLTYKSIFTSSKLDMSSYAVCESSSHFVSKMITHLPVTEQQLLQQLCSYTDGHVRVPVSVIFSGKISQSGVQSLSEAEHGLVALHNKHILTIADSSEGESYVEIGNGIVSALRKANCVKRFKTGHNMVYHTTQWPVEEHNLLSENISSDPLTFLQQVPCVSDHLAGVIVACCSSSNPTVAAISRNLLRYNVSCLSLGVVEALIKTCCQTAGKILLSHLPFLEAGSGIGQKAIPQIDIQKAVTVISNINKYDHHTFNDATAMLLHLNEAEHRSFATHAAIEELLSENCSENGCSQLLRRAINLNNVGSDVVDVFEKMLKKVKSFESREPLREFQNLLHNSPGIAAASIPFILFHKINPKSIPPISPKLHIDIQSVVEYVGNSNPTFLKSGGISVLQAIYKSSSSSTTEGNAPEIENYPTDLHGEIIYPKLGAFLLQKCSDSGKAGEDYLSRCDGLNVFLIPCVLKGSFLYLKILSRRKEEISICEVEKLLDSTQDYADNSETVSLFRLIIKCCLDHNELVSLIIRKQKLTYLPSMMKELDLNTCRKLLKQALCCNSDDACRALSTMLSHNDEYFTDLCDFMWPQPSDELIRYPNSPVVITWGGVDWDYNAVSSLNHHPRGFRLLMKLFENRELSGFVYCYPCSDDLVSSYWKISSQKCKLSSSRLYSMTVPYLHFGILASGKDVTKALVCSSLLGLPKDLVVSHFMSEGPTGIPYWISIVRSEEDENILRNHFKQTVLTEGIHHRYLREYFLSRNEQLMIFKSLPKDLGNIPSSVAMRVFSIIQLNVDVERNSAILKGCLQLLRTASGCDDLLKAAASLLQNNQLTGDIHSNVIHALPGATFCDNNMIKLVCSAVDHHSVEVREALKEFLNRSTIRRGFCLDILSRNMSDRVCELLASHNNTDHVSVATVYQFSEYIIRKCALKESSPSMHDVYECSPDLNKIYFEIVRKLSVDNQLIVANEIASCEDMVRNGSLGCSISLIKLIPDLSLMPSCCQNECTNLAVVDEEIIRFPVRFRALQDLMQRSSSCIVSVICSRLLNVKSTDEYSRLVACLNPVAPLPKSVFRILEDIAECEDVALARRSLSIIAPDAVTRKQPYYFNFCE